MPVARRRGRTDLRPRPTILNSSPFERETRERMTEPPFVELAGYEPPSVDEMKRRAHEFYETARRRRSVRHFSRRRVPREVIETCLRSAGSAPSGANLQPWHFVVVESPDIKRRIRAAAEKEEREFYASRAPRAWLDALAPLGTDSNKPFLEDAPYLIVIFEKRYDVAAAGTRVKHYYSGESTGIATGLLITALSHSGLATLTHTPSPMKFLSEILDRPETERPFLILVAGYPSEDALVPNITKKSLEEISTFV